MSVRQLAQTVRFGRLITFHIFDGDPITGYLAGMDDDYFYVLQPTEGDFDRQMILRAGNPAIRLHPEVTYAGEPQREAMDEIIGPFRGWVTANLLSVRDSDARKAP